MLTFYQSYAFAEQKAKILIEQTSAQSVRSFGTSFCITGYGQYMKLIYSIYPTNSYFSCFVRFFGLQNVNYLTYS